MKTSELEEKLSVLYDSIDVEKLEKFYNDYLIEAPDFFVRGGYYSVGSPGDEFYEEGHIESAHIKTTEEFEKLINWLKETMNLLYRYCYMVHKLERAVDGVLKYAEDEAKAGHYENIISARALGQALSINFNNELRFDCNGIDRFNERVKYLQHLAPSSTNFQQSKKAVRPYSLENQSQEEENKVKYENTEEHEGTNSAQMNPTPLTQRTEPSPQPAQQKHYRKSELPALKGKNLLFKNDAEQKKWAGLFIKFLKQHKRSNEELSTTAENYINRTLFRFIFEWEKSELLRSERNIQAPSVFLFVSCKLKGIEFRAHANVINTLGPQCFNSEDRNDDLHRYVAEFVTQHKTTTINTTKD